MGLPDPCGQQHMAGGLWSTRDRERVALVLERALFDSALEVQLDQINTVLALSLRASLGDPAAEDHSAWRAAQHRAAQHPAATLAQRQGRALTSAALAILWAHEQEPKESLNTPDMQAAREVLAAHADELSEAQLKWVREHLGIGP